VKRSEKIAARIDLLVEKFGGQKPLARLLGVSDAAIIAWRGGAEPLDRTLHEIAARTGIPLQWLRDGAGDTADALGALEKRVAESPRTHYGTPAFTPTEPMDPASPQCRRVIEHITRHLSTEHFTEAQLHIMQDSSITTGERERIAQHMAAILANRLSAKQSKRQNTN